MGKENGYIHLFTIWLLILRSAEGTFQSAVLAKHNLHRGNAGLTLLQWNAGLAAKAQEHTDNLAQPADSCGFAHSTSAFRDQGQGENLYKTSATGITDDELGTTASTAWYSEISKYKYPLLTDPVSKWDFCVDWTKVGHFSQMMWAQTTEIGCGFTACNFNGHTIVTCHYLPAGNMQGASMFAEENYNQLIASGEVLARCGGGTTTTVTVGPADTTTNEPSTSASVEETTIDQRSGKTGLFAIMHMASGMLLVGSAAKRILMWINI
ncbi:uncharacterized protein LOC134855019 [Symsagittifera roscoffensis]|uniref:uncharacterized protein LOC134855019 n=1 Tax=Symsagittifera roscoffensis TaxID=84072 RepID=UPI00307B5578